MMMIVATCWTIIDTNPGSVVYVHSVLSIEQKPINGLLHNAECTHNSTSTPHTFGFPSSPWTIVDHLVLIAVPPGSAYMELE